MCLLAIVFLRWAGARKLHGFSNRCRVGIPPPEMAVGGSDPDSMGRCKNEYAEVASRNTNLKPQAGLLTSSRLPGKEKSEKIARNGEGSDDKVAIKLCR